MGEEQGVGFGSGAGCAVVGGVGVAAAWGLYLLVTTVINDMVSNRAETITAQAEASVLYAQSRQMDMVTKAAWAMVLQGQMLPWVMGAVMVLMLGIVLWLVHKQQQRQEELERRQLVILAALGKLTPEEVA